MPQRRTTALAAPQRRVTALAAPQRRVTALAAPQRRVTALAALCAALLVAAAWGFHVGNTPTPAVPVAHRVATTTRAQATTKQPTTRIKAVPPTTTPPPTTAAAAGDAPQAGAHALPGPGSRKTGPLSTQILTGSSSVALTFDDGPDPTYTPQILDLLKDHGVKATFCVIGSRARDYPDLIRRIVAEGHTLCNHSWQHLLNLGKRPLSYQTWDLEQTNNAIHAAVPDVPIRYFRAPGGNFTRGLIDLAGRLGMSPLSWDVDPRDWDTAGYGRGTPMVNHITSVVEHTVRPGSIILSHDRAHPDTVVAYRSLLSWLQARYTLTQL